MFKTLLDASKHLLLVREPLVHGSEHLSQGRARGRCLHRLSKESTRIFRCSDGQMVLGTPSSADFIDERQAPTEAKSCAAWRRTRAALGQGRYFLGPRSSFYNSLKPLDAPAASMRSK